MLPNSLYYGDNFDWMRQWPSDSVDLIYLDPPFNSNQTYNQLFVSGLGDASAQARAFEDTWRWGQQAVKDRDSALAAGGELATVIQGFETMLGRSGMFAYLCHLAPRLHEMRRLLKQSGSLYLHCDDTASHHVKLLLDAVFGATNYRNAVYWRRATAHNDAKRFGRIVDTIFLYAKSDVSYWRGQAISVSRTESELAKRYPSSDEFGRFRTGDLTAAEKRGGESGKPWSGYDVDARNRHWAIPKTSSYAEWIEENFIPDYRAIVGVHDRLDALDDAGLIHHPQRGFWPGLKRYAAADTPSGPQNLVLDPIGFTNYNKGKEYLGYPTQKPEGLLKQLIEVACPQDGLVMDPYCGCGTTLHVAQASGRPWIGIDITHLAIAVVEFRFRERLNEQPNVIGRPEDMDAARDLFGRDPFQFEAWAVSRLRGMLPNERKTGDRGIDGRGYARDNGQRHLVMAQVKGGKNVGASVVRGMLGSMADSGAIMGVLIVMDNNSATSGVRSDLAVGSVEIAGRTYPKLQLFTIEDYFSGKYPDLPIMLTAFANREPDMIDLADQGVPFG
ncbi:MAG: DNA methyltransferase [Chloroflexi bacterium]|nr:DNA methyltransferase [Chloroflexota bacterium]